MGKDENRSMEVYDRQRSLEQRLRERTVNTVFEYSTVLRNFNILRSFDFSIQDELWSRYGLMIYSIPEESPKWQTQST